MKIKCVHPDALLLVNPSCNYIRVCIFNKPRKFEVPSYSQCTGTLTVIKNHMNFSNQVDAILEFIDRKKEFGAELLILATETKGVLERLKYELIQRERMDILEQLDE